MNDCPKCKIITHDDKELIIKLFNNFDEFMANSMRKCSIICPTCFPEILIMNEMLCRLCYQKLEKKYEKVYKSKRLRK